MGSSSDSDGVGGTSGARPAIRQISRVMGKTIVLRNVQPDDAQFILSLRLDARKNRYLSAVDADTAKQRAWIEHYLASAGQAYFIICDKALVPLGTVRIYGAVGDSFSWGSWILKDGAPPAAAIESAVLVYRLATVCWGFRSAHFQVHRANVSVLGFHVKFGARVVAETLDEIYLRIEGAQIEQSLKRYAKYLPTQLFVK